MEGSGTASPKRLAFTSQGGLVRTTERRHGSSKHPQRDMRLLSISLAGPQQVECLLKLNRALCHPGSSDGAVRLTKGRGRIWAGIPWHGHPALGVVGGVPCWPWGQGIQPGVREPATLSRPDGGRSNYSPAVFLAGWAGGQAEQAHTGQCAACTFSTTSTQTRLHLLPWHIL